MVSYALLYQPQTNQDLGERERERQGPPDVGRLLEQRAASKHDDAQEEPSLADGLDGDGLERQRHHQRPEVTEHGRQVANDLGHREEILEPRHALVLDHGLVVAVGEIDELVDHRDDADERTHAIREHTHAVERAHALLGQASLLARPRAEARAILYDLEYRIERLVDRLHLNTWCEWCREREREREGRREMDVEDATTDGNGREMERKMGERWRDAQQVHARTRAHDHERE